MISTAPMLWLSALAIDLAFGEPPRALHPVVLMGWAIGTLERAAPRDDRPARAFGALVVGLPTIGAYVIGTFLDGQRWSPVRTALSVFILKSTFALRELVGAAARVERALAADAVDLARDELRSLVSRPTEELAAHQIASAAIESLAENLADSYIGPLLFYRFGGIGAAIAYRVVNTADAMIGYRGRYEHLGKAAARADDAANYVPSRVSALAVVTAAPFVCADAHGAWQVARNDHGRTASPNAGWPMAAAAGALGLRLEKPRHYALGDGAAPSARDIRRARRLVMAAAVLVTAAVLATYPGARR